MKTNYPNPLLYGGPAHKYHDRDNSTTTTLAGNGEFVGEWQTNTSQDVMILCDTPFPIGVILQFSPDGGATAHEEIISVPETQILYRKKGSRAFRIKVINTSENPLPFLRVYTYYGDFNVEANSDIILRGDGDGTEESPLVQHIESQPIEELLLAVIKELKKMNLQLAIMTDTHIRDTEI